MPYPLDNGYADVMAKGLALGLHDRQLRSQELYHEEELGRQNAALQDQLARTEIMRQRAEDSAAAATSKATALQDKSHSDEALGQELYGDLVPPEAGDWTSDLPPDQYGPPLSHLSDAYLGRAHTFAAASPEAKKLFIANSVHPKIAESEIRRLTARIQNIADDPDMPTDVKQRSIAPLQAMIDAYHGSMAGVRGMGAPAMAGARLDQQASQFATAEQGRNARAAEAAQSARDRLAQSATQFEQRQSQQASQFGQRMAAKRLPNETSAERAMKLAPVSDLLALQKDPYTGAEAKIRIGAELARRGVDPEYERLLEAARSAEDEYATTYPEGHPTGIWSILGARTGKMDAAHQAIKDYERVKASRALGGSPPVAPGTPAPMSPAPAAKPRPGGATPMAAAPASGLDTDLIAKLHAANPQASDEEIAAQYLEAKGGGGGQP